MKKSDNVEFKFVGNNNFGENNKIDGVERGIYQNGELIIPFLSYEQVSNKIPDGKFLLYVYAILENDKIKLKFGYSKDSITERYKETSEKVCLRCISMMFVSWNDYENLKKLPENKNFIKGNSVPDKLFHNKAQKLTSVYYEKSKDDSDGAEVYLIKLYKKSIKDSIKNFIKDIEKTYKNVEPVKTKTYKDIIQLANDIYCSAKNYIYMDLCARWGKTRTVLELCVRYLKLKNVKFSVMFSYVSTVDTSYHKEIWKNYSGNVVYYHLDELLENWKDDEYRNNIKDELNFYIENGKHCMLYFPLTGTENNYNNRLSIFDELNKICYSNIVTFIEEADFGAWCDNKGTSKLERIFKFNETHDVVRTHVLSGTGFEKCMKFFKNLKEDDFDFFKMSYVKDLLIKK